MKVDYEELQGFYKCVRYGRPGDGEYEDAIESIIDTVPDIVRERKAIEVENDSLRRLVKWLACELEKQSYSFTAEDWMKLAREAVAD